MTKEEVTQLATAIAKANSHPSPADYAADMVKYFTEVVEVPLVVESAPVTPTY
jgi:hypothetical protein